MKFVSVCLTACLLCGVVSAQTPSVKQLQANARVLMQQGDFDNAVVVLLKARQQDPLNTELLKDLAFTYYLQRNFSRSIETGKIVIAMDSADQQAFQILGLSYKSIAAYKEANKMYRAALKKFPDGGVIYNELGESLALEKNLKEAIVQWENGIRLDPNFSGNYFNAAKYYAGKKNWTRVLLYAELFANLESFTARTPEVKNQLLMAYKALLVPGTVSALMADPAACVFEKEILAILNQCISGEGTGTSTEKIAGIRNRFITEWNKNAAQQYPYRLFGHWQYLVKENLFEAYNQWLFADATDENSYAKWQAAHAKEFASFQQFQQSRVFKIPATAYFK